jgi:hypothetical protein
MRARCAADRCLWILACNCSEVRFEIFNAHCGQLLAFGRLRHWPPPFITGLALRGLSSAKDFANSLYW